MKKTDTRNEILNLFEKDCRKHFQFLETMFGCTAGSCQRIHWNRSLTYQNHTTAVTVSYEPIEGGVFVRLCRLVNGQIPKYPIFVTQGMTLHSFDLDDLVSLKRPDAPKRQAEKQLFSKKHISKSLRERAAQLRELGSDILRGDFTIFADLEKIVKARIPPK